MISALQLSSVIRKSDNAFDYIINSLFFSCFFIGLLLFYYDYTLIGISISVGSFIVKMLLIQILPVQLRSLGALQKDSTVRDN